MSPIAAREISDFRSPETAAYPDSRRGKLDTARALTDTTLSDGRAIAVSQIAPLEREWRGKSLFATIGDRDVAD